MNINKEQKTELSKLLAIGHRKFGNVAPRQPYRDDDESGGGAGFRFDTHPLLADQPVGAPSDLSTIVAEHSQAELTDTIKENSDRLSNDLQAQPAFQHALGATQTHTTTPNPLGKN